MRFFLTGEKICLIVVGLNMEDVKYNKNNRIRKALSPIPKEDLKLLYDYMKGGNPVTLSGEFVDVTVP